MNASLRALPKCPSDDSRHARRLGFEGKLCIHPKQIASVNPAFSSSRQMDPLERNLPQARVGRFSFRAVRPLFDIHRFTVCGRPDGEARVALWARDHEGWLAMEAGADLN